MGSDIHPFIEKHVVDSEGKVYVRNIAKVHMSRNYVLFELLAGVRGSAHPLFPPKGMPKEISSYVMDDYGLYVSDDPGADENEKCVSKEQAIRWINNGDSTWLVENMMITGPDWHSESYLNVQELEIIQREYSKGAIKKSYTQYFENQKFIKQMLDDLPQHREKILKTWGELDIKTSCSELNGIIAMMKAMEETEPKAKMYLVFYFDN